MWCGVFFHCEERQNDQFGIQWLFKITFMCTNHLHTLLSKLHVLINITAFQWVVVCNILQFICKVREDELVHFQW